VLLEFFSDIIIPAAL